MIVDVEEKEERGQYDSFLFHSLYQCHLHLRFLYNVAQSMGRFRVPKTTYLFCDLLEGLRVVLKTNIYSSKIALGKAHGAKFRGKQAQTSKILSW